MQHTFKILTNRLIYSLKVRIHYADIDKLILRIEADLTMHAHHYGLLHNRFANLCNVIVRKENQNCMGSSDVVHIVNLHELS